jgi:hypothetical protein
MKSKIALRPAIAKVNKAGMLLVFPIQNQKAIPSLWHEFFPGTQMRWEWDQDGDTRVSDLWHLREQLSRSEKVIYGKWYRGRATLISFDLYVALLRLLNPDFPDVRGLSFAAREILDILEEDSPISTKQLKKLADLRGRDNEAAYTRALKELWSRLLIVAFGEVDEGAFPSIAIGASRVLFEDLWKQAEDLSLDQAKARLEKYWPAETSAFLKYVRSLQVRKN